MGRWLDTEAVLPFARGSISVVNRQVAFSSSALFNSDLVGCI